ncbi:MAG: UDP-4-amino-4,6-dideoxy-N-acetyl-beta-L-altrosamine transaminase [Pseudomonadota bacterium]
MTKPFLPYGKQEINDADIEAVVTALKSPYLTTGPKVGEFERVFAEYLGVDHAIAVANGTAALHLACMALDVKQGDTVLAPSISFAASANGAAYLGAEIEFADCDPDTGLITPQTFAEAADRADAKGNAAKVAVVVHLNGEHADMAAIAAEAEKRGITLIEDACHALGTQFVDHEGQKVMVGSCRYSAIAVYSTHPVKTVTTGEGGVITTENSDLAKRLELLRNHGIERSPDNFLRQELGFDSNGKANPWYHEMQVLGFNYRLTDIACALGISQMARMDQIATRRRELKTRYDQMFAASNLPVKPIQTPEGVDPVRHLYPVLINYQELGIERGDFCRGLHEIGIGSQVHYIPIHFQPIYQSRYGDLNMPGAEAYYVRVLSLPLYPTMEDGDVDRVVDGIGEVLKNLI